MAKINIRESLNKIDLKTNNKFNLLNNYNSLSLSNEDKKRLAEALYNKNLSEVKSIILNESYIYPMFMVEFTDDGRTYQEEYEAYDSRDALMQFRDDYPREEGYEFKHLYRLTSEGWKLFGYYDESLNEDLSEIKEIKQLDFSNNRVNNLRGIFSTKSFVDTLNKVGLDKFKIRTSRLRNISNGDIKDAWYDLKKNGWVVSIKRDPSLSGFNEVYVFEKIKKNESLNEDVQLYKIVCTYGPTEWVFASALSYEDAEQLAEYYGYRWIDEDGYDWDMYIEEDDESYERVYPFKESLNEKLVDAPQEVIDSLVSILGKYGFVLDPVFKTNPGKTWMGEVHMQVINNDSLIENENYEMIKKYVTKDLIDEIHDLEQKSDCPISWSFGPNKDNKVTGGLTIMKQWVPDDKDESLTEASYGGAYDIEDDMFFTKEEIVEFADTICQYLGDIFGYQYNINNVYLFNDNKKRKTISLYLNIYDTNYIEVESTFRIDMRKIKKPDDLFRVYGLEVEQWFQKAFAREYKESWFDESLTEEINLPGFAVRYISGYLGNGINDSKIEWFRTEEERDRRAVELESKGYRGIKTWKMDNFYHTLPKNESLKEEMELDEYGLPFGFNDWLYMKYGFTSDDMTDEDYDYYWNKYAIEYYNKTEEGKENPIIIRESLYEDLDTIINTPVKEMNDETYRELKSLVDEYLRDRKALGDWPDSSDERMFVKKWYKLADKCKEIAKNGMQGITGYGRLKDFFKIKVLELARTVDNTFLWYIRNQLEKFGELEESLNESKQSFVKKAFAFDIYKDGDKYIVVNGDGDTVYKSDSTLDCLRWAKKNSSKAYNFNNEFKFSRLKESKDLVEDTEEKVCVFTKDKYDGKTYYHGWMTKEEADKHYPDRLKEAIEDEVDFDDYNDYGYEVEEGSNFFEDGNEWTWEERIAGPVHLDFDNWAVWSAREAVDIRDFIIGENDHGGWDIDEEAFITAKKSAPIVYFVVDEDTGFIDWGPVENEVEAKDFLNSKVEDWENDEFEESLKENKDLNESIMYDLHYDDIGDGEGTSYDYRVPYKDILEFLVGYVEDEEDVPQDKEELLKHIDTNFDKYFKEYEYDILNHFFERATNDYFNNRD